MPRRDTILRLALLGLVEAALLSPPELPSSARVLQRRTAVSALVLANAASWGSPAHALFESATQRSLQSLSSSLPRVSQLAAEVAEIKRLRTKLPADPDDDAYVLRFGRIVLGPLNAAVDEATPSFGPPFREFADDFRSHTAALDVACRERAADKELAELRAIEDALKGMLNEAASAKYNVQPKDDINGYSGAKGILYNKLLFRAG